MTTLTLRQATPDDATKLAHMLNQFDHMGTARKRACQSVLTTFIWR